MRDTKDSPHEFTYAAPPKMERPLHVDDSKAILTEALSRLGLLKTVPQVPSSEMMPISYWVIYCRLLHLPLDSISWGYSYRQQRYQIGLAWKEGRLLLPRTQELKSLLKDFKKEARRECNYFKNSCGRRLRWVLYKKFLLEELRQQPQRLLTGLRVRLETARHSLASYVSMLIEKEASLLSWNASNDELEVNSVGLRTDSSRLLDEPPIEDSTPSAIDGPSS